jgi:phenylpropionate dioxygenase-like ring-hydroxylating dioxygenase large terminal subunit
MVGAYCPHLGARLDEGGKMAGDSIVCPFHCWQFDLDGHCARVPFCEEAPRQASLGTLPVEERFGMIFAWRHPDGNPPMFPLPDALGADVDFWTAWDCHQRVVRSHVYEWAEQAADPAHLPGLHGILGMPRPVLLETDGDIFRSSYLVEIATPAGPAEVELEVTMHGLGIQILRLRGAVDLLMFNAPLPIEPELMYFRHSVRFPTTLWRDHEQLACAWRRQLIRFADQDARIFETKRYNPNPILADYEQKPITVLREWAERYYHTNANRGASGEELG